MRTFDLVRLEDVSGVSGTGPVAEGAVSTNGKATLFWTTRYQSVAVYDSIEELACIHLHGDKTRLAWHNERNLEQIDLDLLAQSYRFLPTKDGIGVAQFLLCHPYLVPLLYQGAEKAREHFPGCTLSLKVEYDPEGRGVDLVAGIHSEVRGVSAVHLINEFDSAWWLEEVHAAEGKLIFLPRFWSIEEEEESSA